MGGAWAATSVTTSKPQGEGSSSNPFQISNAQKLAWFRDWVNGTYTPKDGESASEHEKACAKLTANIDMSTVCGKNIGSWSPIREENGGDGVALLMETTKPSAICTLILQKTTKDYLDTYTTTLIVMSIFASKTSSLRMSILPVLETTLQPWLPMPKR